MFKLIATKKIVKTHWDDFLSAYYWQECQGCKEGHNSFWKTVIESPQWKLWQDEQNKRMKTGKIVKGKWNKSCYDMPEVEEGGVISPKHFQEFLKFLGTDKKQAVKDFSKYAQFWITDWWAEGMPGSLKGIINKIRKYEK